MYAQDSAGHPQEFEVIALLWRNCAEKVYADQAVVAKVDKVTKTLIVK